jgi:hypothetical protein
MPFLAVSMAVLAIAFGMFVSRLYTECALPALNENLSFLPSRQFDQLRRYIEMEEHAGRKRWYFGLVRRAMLIQAGLLGLFLATAVVSV